MMPRGRYSPNVGLKSKHQREYQSWMHMRARCLNPNNHAFSSYGGRGISICKNWNDFRRFLADMGERPAGCSLDRIDNNGNYCAANCRWATTIKQQNNKRDSRFYTWRGKTMTRSQWARELGISITNLYNRLERHGWSVEDAFSQPLLKGTRPGKKSLGRKHKIEATA